MVNDLEYPMRLQLICSGDIEFSCLEDLSKVIPDNCSGKPLNYGQCEGQVEINEAVWGFYVDASGMYHMAFEEGRLDWQALNTLVESIVSSIEQSFGVVIELIVVGPFTDRTDV